MRRVLIAAFAALIVGIGLVWTQPTEAWLAQVPASAAAYTGPGDITALKFFISATRAYNAATAGNALMNVCNSTGGIDVGCADMSTSASTGILVPQTISAITCPGANCTIKTFYDPTSANYCASGACNYTQATVAKRAALTASVFGSLPGAVFSSGDCYNTPGSANLPAEPLSVTFYGQFTGSSQASVFFGQTNIQLGYHNSAANQVFIYDGAVLRATASDAAAHAIQATFDAAASNGSTINVDGSSTTATMSAGQTMSQPYTFGTTSNLCTGQPWTGNFGEMGMVDSLFSGGTITSLSSNQTTFY